jgi:hypothetical protein
VVQEGGDGKWRVGRVRRGGRRGSVTKIRGREGMGKGAVMCVR